MHTRAPTAQPAGGHSVCFYQHERELVDAVCAELAAAERAGGAMIVIATPEHVAAFDQALAGCGWASDALRGCGRLVCLDAAATLAALRPDGRRFDRARFRDLVGRVVEAAGAAAGGRVAAYGEMVALLWDAGEVLAAIELESLWNELGQELEFSLLCGYPVASLGRSGDDMAIAEVCRLHDRLLGAPPPRADATVCLDQAFAPEIDAPGRARERAVEELRALGYEDELIERAAIVVTELASNAVLHAGTDFRLTVRPQEGTLHVSVEDGRPLVSGKGPATPLIPRPTRGLALVDGVARSWGFAPRPAGKIVWAELD